MSATLTDIARQLKDAGKKVQLIYAFNGTGKTRLSRAFKQLISPKAEGEEAQASELADKKVLYYSAFTEDLFYWRNDLERDLEPKLMIQPNAFTRWVLEEQGQDQSITTTFQRYTSDKLTPHFSADFSSVSWLDKPSDGIVEKTRKVHDDHVHDFVFDDGRIQNIYLLDKKNIARNKVQVIKQFEQTGTHANRYDVSILVNGLPLVQVELKKRGVAIREAFNQVHRYSKESFNSAHSLFKYLQLFVISNGTDSRYFANTTQRNKNSFDFTMNWAQADNSLIKDLKDFTATFFQKDTLLKVLLRYSVCCRPSRAPTGSLTPPRPSATSSPSATWSRRPSTPSPCSATRTQKTWCWRRASRNTWTASPTW